MNSLFAGLLPVLPEIFLAVMVAVILLIGVFAKNYQQLPYYLVQATLIVGAGLTLYCYYSLDKTTGFTFYHSYIFDQFALVLKLFVYGVSLVVFIYSRQYNQDRHIMSNEFHVLGLLAIIGMLVLISAYNLLTLYLGLELLSLPLYALVAIQRAKMRCVEAAMKYFVVGGLASGMLLYGISILFGVTHSLDIATIAANVKSLSNHNDVMLIFALVFVVAGMAFKLGAVPFHMWVPDVYDGAPTSVTILISAAPKIAGFALFVRILVEGLPELFGQWQHMLLAVGLLSIALGNVVAIVQVNIKRMLAYSSISHMGFALLGLAAGTEAGNTAANFYILTYTLMSLGGFGIVALMSRAGYEANDIDDYAGLNNRNPWLAFMMLLLMFSMAGVPPLVGFIAKLSILDALVQVNLTWVAVVALLFAIVGAYYYIRIIKVMYFDQPLQAELIACPRDTKIAISLNGLVILVLGIFPGSLFKICQGLF